jgi:hypothetical protein
MNIFSLKKKFQPAKKFFLPKHFPKIDFIYFNLIKLIDCLGLSF